MALDPQWRQLVDTILRIGLPRVVTPLLEQLLVTNLGQWELEDQAHDPQRGADLPRLKHAIDARNARRNSLIIAIDEQIVAEFRPSLYDVRDGLFRNSESIGRLLDRLTIAVIRRHFLGDDDRLDSVHQQFQFHLAVLRELLEHLQAGTASYAPETDVKDYRTRRGS